MNGEQEPTEASSEPSPFAGTPEAISVPPPRTPQTSTKSILALVFSAIGIMVLPLIGSVAGLVLAGIAAKEIKRSGGWVTGKGLVTAARWVGWIGVIYGLLVATLIGLGLSGWAPTGWHTTVNCKDAAWFAEIRADAVKYVPEGSNPRIDMADCYTDGGFAQVQLDTPVAYDQAEKEFNRRAIADGWQRDEFEPECLLKNVQGASTYMYLSSPEGNTFTVVADVDGC